MRAKDYAKMFNENPTQETLEKIAEDFLMDIKALIEIRHAKSDEAALSILNEQDQKWQAFARLVPGINPEGFRYIVQEAMPQIYAVWMRGRRTVTLSYRMR